VAGELLAADRTQAAQQRGGERREHARVTDDGPPGDGMHKEVEQGVATLLAEQSRASERDAGHHHGVEERGDSPERGAVTEVEAQLAPHEKAQRSGHEERPAAYTTDPWAQQEPEHRVEQADGDGAGHLRVPQHEMSCGTTSSGEQCWRWRAPEDDGLAERASALGAQG